jgi:hypothetical protein
MIDTIEPETTFRRGASPPGGITETALFSASPDSRTDDTMTLTLRTNRQKKPGNGGGPMSKHLKQLEVEELYQLSARIDEDPHKIAVLLFPEKPAERIALTETIGQWAINQAVVLENTQKGKMDLAIVFNKVGNRIWQKLPRYARCVRIIVE